MLNSMDSYDLRGNCLIQLENANHVECRFKFENKSQDGEVIGSSVDSISLSLSDHTCPPNCVNYRT